MSHRPTWSRRRGPSSEWGVRRLMVDGGATMHTHFLGAGPGDEMGDVVLLRYALSDGT
ncbi:hypothetical protein GA0074696_4676 [Micromonospora purpureochromogenes]|uniref:Uncharacterized protein n=1 Tax=Micromonospora purpureochromogenes TaxID=47872 RepID=A0A1C4ZNZ0_9ACTN|nr:hypothetical protein GA0074696_4676 [Micromonospora purpureochromogenes]